MTSAPPPIPGRVFDLALVDDGSRVYVNTTTGEITGGQPSATRAARLQRRAAIHHARVQAENAEFAAAAGPGAALCRAALPARIPPGLERDRDQRL